MLTSNLKEEILQLLVIRACVISGGGAFGSCGLGTLAALNQTYQIVAGVSTGSLMAPLVALNEYQRLEHAYTSVTQSDIFDFNPFTKKGKIHIPKAIWRIITGKATLGDSVALRKTIDKFLSEDDFFRLEALNKNVLVACQETSKWPAWIHHFSSQERTATDFKDYMWASANSPLVMSLLQKDGGEWTDAGVTELLSLKKVIELGAREVDVIIHRPRPEVAEKGQLTNVFHNAGRLWQIMRSEIEDNDLAIGLQLAQQYKCKVNVYWLPKKLASNSLLFDKATMKSWFDLGYQTAFDENRIDQWDFSRSSQTVLA